MVKVISPEIKLTGSDNAIKKPRVFLQIKYTVELSFQDKVLMDNGISFLEYVELLGFDPDREITNDYPYNDLDQMIVPFQTLNEDSTIQKRLEGAGEADFPITVGRVRTVRFLEEDLQEDTTGKGTNNIVCRVSILLGSTKTAKEPVII
jgi:hypothetical protein